LFQLGITRALEYSVRGVPRPGRKEVTGTIEVFDDHEVVGRHACPTPCANCAEAVADAAWQALMSWNYSGHRDLKNSIYGLYPQRKKGAFKISQLDLHIIRGEMSHNTSLSPDLSDYLLAPQRENHYLRTRLEDTEDTLRAHQRIQTAQESDFYSLDPDTWTTSELSLSRSRW
jgi:hypothetical protein